MNTLYILTYSHTYRLSQRITSQRLTVASSIDGVLSHIYQLGLQSWKRIPSWQVSIQWNNLLMDLYILLPDEMR